jgi:hypothetical protein
LLAILLLGATLLLFRASLVSALMCSMPSPIAVPAQPLKYTQASASSFAARTTKRPGLASGSDHRPNMAAGTRRRCGRHSTPSNDSAMRSDSDTSAGSRSPAAATVKSFATHCHVVFARHSAGKWRSISVRTSARVASVITPGIVRSCGSGTLLRRHAARSCGGSMVYWSERRDLNSRPPVPQAVRRAPLCACLPVH